DPPRRSIVTAASVAWALAVTAMKRCAETDCVALIAEAASGIWLLSTACVAVQANRVRHSSQRARVIILRRSDGRISAAARRGFRHERCRVECSRPGTPAGIA